METNEIGSPASQGPCADDDTVSLKRQLEEAKKREQALLEQHHQHELDFGQKRAKFKELFMQKEEELKRAVGTLTEIQDKYKTLEDENNKLSAEIGDIRQAAAILESGKLDEIEVANRKYEEEVASMQHIMKDAVAQATQNTATKYEQERIKWAKANERLEQELQEMKSKLAREREGFLASVAKSIKRVGGGSSLTQEEENLEDSMKKAQEDAEILKSVVLPLEEEIASLKHRLRQADNRIQDLEAQSVILPLEEEVGALKTKLRETDARVQELEGQLILQGGESEQSTSWKAEQQRSPAVPALKTNGSTEDGKTDTPEDKIRELNKYLTAEKSCRTDLEMYVAVLNTQKNLLQQDEDRLRAELHEVCRMLEQEKREHNDLKRTWTMANDQFLESQRLMMMDMRRMESVLTAEQSRQLTELKKKDAEREAQEKRVQELEEMSRKERLEQEQRREEEKKQAQINSPSSERPAERPLGIHLDHTDTASKTSLTSDKSDDIGRFDDDSIRDELGLKRSQSMSPVSVTSRDLIDSGIHDTKSLHEVDGAIVRASPDRVLSVGLTEAQQRAITDPTPESEASQSILASAKAKLEAISMVGKRLVSEKEWAMLQHEVKGAREKLGRQCDMCSNYEAQLQTAQEQDKKSAAQVRTLERQLQSERNAIANQTKYTEEIEETLKSTTEDAQKQISTLVTKLQDSEKFIQEMRELFIQSQSDLQDQLKTLVANREEIHKELTRLQEENDSLIGKHSKHSQEMQEESIELPNNLEEMQLLLLKYREEIITAKAAKEHIEDTLRSEIMFLKAQVVAEQQEKATLEETLSQEISQLQEELAILQSVKSELERQTTLKNETDTKLKDTETSLKNIQAKSKQLINALQNQLEEQTNARTRLEAEVGQMRAKVQSLQIDLDNSEAVQRDFVKLSQSLQIQLEKIRQGENEVRWQHEEDVEECTNCRQVFTVTRRKDSQITHVTAAPVMDYKHHCRHCVKIFCSDCLTKTVNSGPNLRPSKVCDVCHTILVQDATPYFSTEPPATPD